MKNYNRQIIIPLLSAVLAALLGAAVFAVGIYRFGWDGAAARAVAGVVPYPAAIVDGRFVLFSEYLRARDDFGRFGFETDEIMRMLVRRKVIAMFAEEKGVKVSEQLAGDYYRHLLSRLGPSEERLLAEEANRDVLEKQLRVELLKENLGGGAYQRATLARDRIDEGLPFAEAAREYSDDQETRYIGGDLGVVAPEDLSPWLSSAAFDLEEGGVSRTVVSPSGYHILRLQAATGDGRRSVQHIFFASDYAEKMIQERQDRASVFVYNKFE